MGALPRPRAHFNTDPRWFEILIEWARSEPEVTSLWLFGSRGSGVRWPKDDPSPIPDLDIAFEVEGDTAHERDLTSYVGGLETRAQLSEQLGVSLDLHHLDGAEAKLKAYVDATGVCFWRRDTD